MPTKAELIKLLEGYSDDTEIVLWKWNSTVKHEFSTIELLNPTCACDKPDQKVFMLMHSGIFFDPHTVNEKLIVGTPTKTGTFEPWGDFVRTSPKEKTA